MPEIGRLLSFDTGIERIVTQQDVLESTVSTKPTRDFPADGILEQRMVEPPSVEQELTESFRPNVDHRDVLTPVGYQAALHESKKGLETAIKQMPEGQAREILKTAAERLDNEQSLRDLLNTYRNLLHQA